MSHYIHKMARIHKKFQDFFVVFLSKIQMSNKDIHVEKRGSYRSILCSFFLMFSILYDIY